jgi:arylsulfatase A-like enzyme
VVIFADDAGYGDLACYGNEKIKTHCLDRMAEEGVRLTDFYVCAPVCSPSREGLLTGRYPIRSGLTRVLFPQSKTGIDEDDITVAQMLQKQGYTTACIGKWHLGCLPQFMPNRHGFDYYFGLPYSNDMEVTKRGDPPLPLMRNDEIVEQPANQDLLTKRYTEEAIAFIERSKDQPFFLYLPHSMPHIPLHVSDGFRGKSAGGLYGDVIEEIDWSSGEIIDTIRKLGLAENTLVIFTSDNGPWLSQGDASGTAGPLREGKNTTFEGGMREPCIAWWPGRIPPGRVEHGMACTLDFLPTFVHLAGGAPTQDRIIDGRDIYPLLTGEGQRADQEFLYYSGDSLEAIRLGKWKLKRPFKGKVYGKPLEHGVLLFDIEADPGEKNNLAEANPDIVDRLERRMKAFEKNLGPVPKTKW